MAKGGGESAKGENRRLHEMQASTHRPIDSWQYLNELSGGAEVNRTACAPGNRHRNSDLERKGASA